MALTQASLRHVFEQQKRDLKDILHVEEIIKLLTEINNQEKRRERKEQIEQHRRVRRNVSTNNLLTQF